MEEGADVTDICRDVDAPSDRAGGRRLEDIANAALYLCSDAGRYVGGTQLRVDAGSGVK